MTLPARLDPSIPLLDLPEGFAARLRRNESSQRSRVKKANEKIEVSNAKLPSHKIHQPTVPVQAVDIVQHGIDQNWTCQCHRAPSWAGCYRRVDVTKAGRDPAAAVIGHIVAASLGGAHTKKNVVIMRHECNDAIAKAQETTAAARTKRLRKKHLGVNPDGSEYQAPKKQKIRQRKGWGKTGSRWPQGRKIQSQNNLRKRP